MNTLSKSQLSFWLSLIEMAQPEHGYREGVYMPRGYVFVSVRELLRRYAAAGFDPDPNYVTLRNFLGLLRTHGLLEFDDLHSPTTPGFFRFRIAGYEAIVAYSASVVLRAPDSAEAQPECHDGADDTNQQAQPGGLLNKWNSNVLDMASDARFLAGWPRRLWECGEISLNLQSMSDVKYSFLDLRAASEPIMAELEAAATRVIRSGRYVGGEEVAAFESELASLIATRHAVGVGSGLDALRLTLRALVTLGRLKPGDGVIVAANTYIASVLAIIDAGLRPVLVDPDISTMNLDAEGMKRGLREGAKAVMPVHLYGRVCWSDAMRELAREEGLIVIEDVAQAINAQSAAKGLGGGDMAGALGHAGCFSFYPTKNVGALGEAGAVTTDDKELADAVRALANYGSDRRYHNVYAGFNCRLDPIQAAMLRVKLGRLPEVSAHRFERAVVYDRMLQNPLLTKPAIPSTIVDCVWHQYVVRIAADKREAFRRGLLEAGVETDIHYATPPHRQPCLATLPHGPLPVTERLADEVVSLPIGDHLTTQNIAEISAIINSITV